jgi:hypothetical protein
MPIDPNQIGLSSEATQTLSAGVFAAGAREYLRPAVGWRRRVLSSSLTLSGTFLFGPEVMIWLPWLGQMPAKVLAGIACIGVAEALLKAVDRLDLAAFLKKGGNP